MEIVPSSLPIAMTRPRPGSYLKGCCTESCSVLSSTGSRPLEAKGANEIEGSHWSRDAGLAERIALELRR